MSSQKRETRRKKRRRNNTHIPGPPMQLSPQKLRHPRHLQPRQLPPLDPLLQHRRERYTPRNIHRLHLSRSLHRQHGFGADHVSVGRPRRWIGAEVAEEEIDEEGISEAVLRDAHIEEIVARLFVGSAESKVWAAADNVARPEIDAAGLFAVEIVDGGSECGQVDGLLVGAEELRVGVAEGFEIAGGV